MHFKKLELFGFKSFAEKTTLHFEPGITAVVGPNGCGKSNVFDSIRWVLGEQSVKSLRGSKMEDVIFNGTESIPALGYAEVSLTFANETKALPIDYDEVTVTRRLFRSGESEYLLNKTQVRLKDIVELFMGTGVGAESYSLIEQGKIDLILSSRPEDRRLVFDEAAGISKYKSQKRETMRKLEDTEANLLRINDIIAEVKRQINSLERQAARARRYKEVYEKLKELESNLAVSQLTRYQKQLDELNGQLNQLISREMQDTQALETLHNEWTGHKQALDNIEAQLESLRGRQNSMVNKISHDSQALGFDRERISELQKRLAIISKQKEELLVKSAQDKEKINTFKVGLDALNKELEEKKALEARSNSELEEVTRSITSIQIKVKEAKAKILEFASQEAALHNQLRDFTSQFNQAVARKKRLDMEKLKAQEELSVMNQDLQAAQEQEDAALRQFSGQKEECERIKEAHSEVIREKDNLAAQLQNWENEKAGLESQREFLGNLKLRYENITESSNATVFLDSLSDEKISGIIIKVEDVQPAQEGDCRGLVQAKFKARGVAKPISLDPQEIVNRIERLVQEVFTVKDTLTQKTQLIVELAGRLNSTEKSLRDAEIAYTTCKNKKDNIEQQVKKLEDEDELLCFESQDIEVQLNKLSEEERRVNESLFKVKEIKEQNQGVIEQASDEITQKNSAREKILLILTQLKTEISAACEKALSCEETCKILETAFAKDKLDLESLLEEETDSQKRIQELETHIAKLELDLENGQRQKGLLGEEINKNAALLLELKKIIARLQDTISETKNLLDAHKAKIYELQMQAQQVNFQQNGIYERMQQVYKINADEFKENIKEDLNVDEAVQEIDLLKTKIESYGQVNLVAIEEFEELKQRYDFLMNQHADLLKSKESLHEAILKINRTTKKMFLETFDKLAAEFKNYFRLLFGGGDAQLFLIDEQDVLESGIEIVCRPPGKKLQNVLLLSGGEKSMSAIALLFAIFKVKPSPFCVLDEIDAALDEANVDRFSRMLVDFTAQSQFIVITHNKKTIANANIMYGITMEKAGISKIVSVKLAENNKPKPGAENPADIEEQKIPEAV